MQEAQHHQEVEATAGNHDSVAAPLAGLDEHYRGQALQHLRDRGTLNALMVGMLDGSRVGTVLEFEALSHAHDALSREAGAALMCLGAVMASEGTA